MLQPQDGRGGSSWLDTVLPRFEEPLAPEFYRNAGRLRAIAIAILIILNWAAISQIERSGFDVEFFIRQNATFSGLGLVDIALGILIWRRAMSEAMLRSLTIVCLSIDVAIVLLCSWTSASPRPRTRPAP